MALLFIAILLILLSLYTWLKKRYSYWSNRGIKGPKPLPIVGNFGSVMAEKEHVDMLLKKIYNDYPNKACVGIYQGLTPALLVRDPAMIKQILISDFSVFRNRNLRRSYPLNDHVFSTDGNSWKILRRMMTGALTSGKLKNRLPLLAQSADEFLNYVDDSLNRCDYHEFQYDIMWRYNLHAAGATLFGLDLEALSKENNDFKYMLQEMTSPRLHSRVVQYVEQIIPGFQKVASFLKIDNRWNTIADSFKRFVNNVFESRNGQPALLKDFSDYMIELHNNKFLDKEENFMELERNEMVFVNHFAITYLGHVDTSSFIMTMLMKELAFNQKIQDRLLREILELTKNLNGKITYESLNNLVYLEMVLNEVLRKYVVSFMQRQASLDYEFPDTKIKIEKGTIVLVPLFGLHMDPNYFKDPEVFNPDRFSPQNMKNIPDCSFLPFGEGPRICPGMRSAKLQMKYGIAKFLQRFKVETCKKSTKDVQFFITAIALTNTKGVWLKISRRLDAKHNDKKI